jgi:hypothetical protein
VNTLFLKYKDQLQTVFREVINVSSEIHTKQKRKIHLGKMPSFEMLNHAIRIFSILS